MVNTLKLINERIATSDPDNYSNISYGKYYKDLTAISNSVIEEVNSLKEEIMKLDDDQIKIKLLALI